MLGGFPAQFVGRLRMAGGRIDPTHVACPLGWRPVGERPVVARRMTARWRAARRARADDGVACPARGRDASPVRRACSSPAWRVGESRARRVPITAGRARESHARES